MLICAVFSLSEFVYSIFLFKWHGIKTEKNQNPCIDSMKLKLIVYIRSQINSKKDPPENLHTSYLIIFIRFGLKIYSQFSEYFVPPNVFSFPEKKSLIKKLIFKCKIYSKVRKAGKGPGLSGTLEKNRWIHFPG